MLRTVLRKQRRLCMTQMYQDNYPGLPTAKMGDKKSPVMTRSMERNSNQKYDPDWKFDSKKSGIGGVVNELYQQDAKERILTYKLERMDYEVREVPYGTAPPPPTREVSTNITLDVL
eukprot:TRINITY_DN27603_c0_g1_i1.p1 TRINITY_DN27603_c0_g1~~TRINITY_DN27603_c0_g1_i1.p1  ORF type:complete len:132 (+),score=36.23 TRINITY_DN27603_c0_g1_i1:47-397(+)